jgi:hypothetical protein
MPAVIEFRSGACRLLKQAGGVSADEPAVE